MNELPDSQCIAFVDHAVAYRVGFFRERIQKKIMSPGGLYIFCDHVGDQKKIYFYSFDARDFIQMPKGYCRIGLRVPTTKIWQHISANIHVTHPLNKYETQSLEYISVRKENDLWQLYLRNSSGSKDTDLTKRLR